MTIAQVYQHLQTTDFFRLGTTHRQKVEIFFGNPPKRFASRVETQEYFDCMPLGDEVLSNANHGWALELSYLVKMRASPVAVTWLAQELLNGYFRRLKHKVQRALPWIIENFQRYQGMRLSEAIDHANAAAIENNAERAQQRAIQEAEQRDNLVFIEPIPPPPIAPQILADMQTSHAQLNACVAVIVRDSAGSGPRTLFLDRNKMPELLALFTQSAGEDDNVCNTCMIERATHTCGNVGCTWLMCNNCFHEWFLKTPKCPACTREYIPLPLRSSVVLRGPHEGAAVSE